MYDASRIIVQISLLGIFRTIFWCIIFVDNVVIVDETKVGVNPNLES